MYFSQNLKYLRKRRRRTQDEIAQSLNMKRSTLSGYENGVADPGFQQLVLFSDYYGISIDTLLRIDLNNLRESEMEELEKGYDIFIKGGNLRVLATTVDNSNKENIELVPEKAKAGYTRGYADPEYVKDLQVFNLPFLSPERKYRTFQISGDSMLPISSGSWVTGEYIQDWNDIKNGDACIILTLDEGIVFKQVENRIKEEGVLRLVSLNREYAPYDLSVNEIREIWRFVNYISSEMPAGDVSNGDLALIIKELKNDISFIKNKFESNQ